MKKTKEFLKEKLLNADDSYWKCFERLERKEKELKTLQREVESLRVDAKKLDDQREKFRAMLEEVDPESFYLK
jgi:chromosome segregation ATPase